MSDSRAVPGASHCSRHCSEWALRDTICRQSSRQIDWNCLPRYRNVTDGSADRSDHPGVCGSSQNDHVPRRNFYLIQLIHRQVLYHAGDQTIMDETHQDCIGPAIVRGTVRFQEQRSAARSITHSRHRVNPRDYRDRDDHHDAYGIARRQTCDIQPVRNTPHRIRRKALGCPTDVESDQGVGK